MSNATPAFSISFAGHGGSQVIVDILGLENKKYINSSDAKWLRGIVSFRSGPCSFRSSVSLLKDDIVVFHRELDAMLDTLEGSAHLSTIEDTVFIDATPNRRGAVVVSGKLRADEQSKVEVTFAFDSDQSFLESTRLQLREAVKQFGAV